MVFSGSLSTPNIIREVLEKLYRRSYLFGSTDIHSLFEILLVAMSCLFGFIVLNSQLQDHFWDCRDLYENVLRVLGSKPLTSRIKSSATTSDRIPWTVLKWLGLPSFGIKETGLYTSFCVAIWLEEGQTPKA